MSNVAIGGGLLLLLGIIIAVIVLKPWDEGTVPEVDASENDNIVSCSTFDGCPDGMEIIPDANGESESECCQEENDNIVSCSTFDGCPDNMEIIPDANGESESECCQKKTCESNSVQCKTTACSSPEGCWDLLPDVRGDSEEECCVKALCSDDICGHGFNLKDGALSGRSNSDCCEQKPLCASDFVCPGDHSRKAGSPRGDSEDECCIMKKCVDNGWDGTRCESEGKAVGDPNERGNTADICCVTRSCHDNGYGPGSTICPDGMAGVDDSSIIGENDEDCCIAGKCDDNAWDAAKCSLMSSLSKPHPKINEPRGDSVGECCQEKLCSDYYFDGDSCRDREGGPSDVRPWTGNDAVCFTVDNQFPGQEEVEVTERKLKTNCAYTDSTSGPTKLVSGAVQIPGSGASPATQKSTCCIPKTCGELNSADVPIVCPALKKFVPEQTVDTAISTSSLVDQCCTASMCPDDYKSDQDCETALGELGEFYELNNGVDGWAELESSPQSCCKLKKCSDVFSDARCEADNSERPKYNPISADEEIIVDSGTLAATDGYLGVEGANCCTAEKCNETEFSCPEDMVLKEDQPAEEANPTNCCEYKLCSDPSIGWTDEKCRSKDFTRASVRGKLKTNGRVDGPGQGPTAEVTNTNYKGDTNCCEKDPSSYARMCVGNDWHSGQVVSKSVGASIHKHQGVALSVTNGLPSECKRLCDADSSCTTFISTSGNGVTSMGTEGNPKCELYRRIGDEVHVPNIIAGEHMHKKIRVQYVKEGNFPLGHRYSGGTGDVEDLAAGLGDLGIYAPLAARSTNEERENATRIANRDANDAVKGRDIFVAGIDNEFCPFDHLKLYGNHAHANGNLHGTWHPSGTSSQGIPDNHKIGGAGGGCDRGFVKNILDDCYRNQHCGAEWIEQAGTANHERAITYDDPATSKIDEVKFGPLLEPTNRRHCSKGEYGSTQKAWSGNPRHMPLGGAYVTPTRKIKGDKVQYGVVNDKHTWGGDGGYRSWDGLLLPGDTHLPD